MNKVLSASLQPGQLFRLPALQQVFCVVKNQSKVVEAEPLNGTGHVLIGPTVATTVQKRGFTPQQISLSREVWVLDSIEEQVALNGGKTPVKFPCRDWRRTRKCRVDDNH